MLFSPSHVQMWELNHKEGWPPKNQCFQNTLLEKTLQSPLDCKEIQSILKEINPEYSLEGLMLKLNLQYFGHLMPRADSLEKTLILEKTEGKRKREQQWMRWLDSNTSPMDMSLSKRWEIVKDRGAWSATFHGVTESQAWLSNQTTTEGGSGRHLLSSVKGQLVQRSMTTGN